MKILCFLICSIISFLTYASSAKMDQAVLQICRTAIGQAGKKPKLTKADKKKLAKCLKTVNAKMLSCLKEGKKTSLKEGADTKKSMIKLLEAQKKTAICNLDVTIDAVKKYY